MIEQNPPKMTHDEMIDVLKGLVFGTFDRTTAKEREALDIAIKALEQEPKWIPVSERLPEKGGLYLVYTEEQPFVCPFKDGEFFIDEVLAWMPLPEPYAESEDI